MAPRPTWQGHLRLSLVTCPVALYTATQPAGEVRFNLLHKDTHNRIKMVTTDPEIGPVDRSDLVKGYEYEKGQYVIVTPEEIESVRLESTKTIDIERFVDAADIDRLYWNAPYFLKPDGKLAIREAMERTGKVALGRVVMHQRERLLALEPRDTGLLAYTLRSHDEVRKPEEYFEDIPDRKADPQMIAIAEKIIEQQAGPFDPSEFTDRYEDALRDLIEQKKKGKGRIATVEEPKDTNVVDLMEALRKSLGQSGGERRKTAERKPAPGTKSTKKAPAKKAPARKKAS
jgi:DNA end-binding protein Ku